YSQLINSNINKCNQRSINLAERLNFKRDEAMDDIINQGDIVFYK
ncbi:N-acetyltransferase, partial [Staphylococcus aureus]|nr:N-acetyltransferase [Staphylococcus aureus]